MNIDLILIILALVFAVLAAIGIGVGRINLIGASLACYFLSLLV